MCGGVKYSRKKEYKCTLYLIIRNRAITSRHKSMVQGLFFDVSLLCTTIHVKENAPYAPSSGKIIQGRAIWCPYNKFHTCKANGTVFYVVTTFELSD